MKYSNIIIGLFLLSVAVLFTSCLKQKAGEINDEELITTMKLIFTPATGGSPLVFYFDDPDGPGGVAPLIDTIKLAANRNYGLVITLMNNNAQPPVDVSAEILAEAEAHRFYFEATGTDINFSNLSTDGNGKPVGLTSTWATMATAKGNCKITLRHYGATPPDKNIADPVNSPKSSTDIEVVFPVFVQ